MQLRKWKRVVTLCQPYDHHTNLMANLMTTTPNYPELSIFPSWNVECCSIVRRFVHYCSLTFLRNAVLQYRESLACVQQSEFSSTFWVLKRALTLGAQQQQQQEDVSNFEHLPFYCLFLSLEMKLVKYLGGMCGKYLQILFGFLDFPGLNTNHIQPANTFMLLCPWGFLK